MTLSGLVAHFASALDALGRYEHGGAMQHIATEAAHNRLPKGACRECERGAKWCRGGAELNGRDAVWEFTRRLLPWARVTVTGKDAHNG